jgi:hypothetical protein
MTKGKFYQLTDYLVTEELEKFSERISDIGEDNYEEVKEELKQTNSTHSAMFKITDWKNKYNDFYPGEPFFESIFVEYFHEYVCDVLYDIAENAKSLKQAEKLKK